MIYFVTIEIYYKIMFYEMWKNQLFYGIFFEGDTLKNLVGFFLSTLSRSIALAEVWKAVANSKILSLVNLEVPNLPLIFSAEGFKSFGMISGVPMLYLFHAKGVMSFN